MTNLFMKDQHAEVDYFAFSVKNIFHSPWPMKNHRYFVTVVVPIPISNYLVSKLHWYFILKSKLNTNLTRNITLLNLITIILSSSLGEPSYTPPPFPNIHTFTPDTTHTQNTALALGGSFFCLRSSSWLGPDLVRLWPWLGSLLARLRLSARPDISSAKRDSFSAQLGTHTRTPARTHLHNYTRPHPLSSIHSIYI